MHIFSRRRLREKGQELSGASQRFRLLRSTKAKGWKLVAFGGIFSLFLLHSAHAQIDKALSELRSIEAEKERLEAILERTDCIDVPDELDTGSPLLGEEADGILKLIKGSRKKLRDYESRLAQLTAMRERRRDIRGTVYTRVGTLAIVHAQGAYYALTVDSRPGTSVDGRIEVDKGEVSFTDEDGYSRDAQRAHFVDAAHESSELQKAQTRLENEREEVGKRCEEIRSIIARRAEERSTELVKGLGREADLYAQGGEYHEAYLCDSVVAAVQPNRATRARMQASLGAYLASEVRKAKERDNPDAEMHWILRQLRETGDTSALVAVPQVARRQTVRTGGQLRDGRTTPADVITEVERFLHVLDEGAKDAPKIAASSSMREARKLYRELALTAMQQDLGANAALIPSYVTHNDEGFLERYDGFGLYACANIERKVRLLGVTREQLLENLDLHPASSDQLRRAETYFRRNAPPLTTEKRRVESWQRSDVFTLEEDRFDDLLDARRDENADRYKALSDNDAQYVKDLRAQGYRAIGGELSAAFLVDYHFQDIAWKQADPTLPMLVERMHVGGGRVQLQYTIRRFLFGVHAGYAQSFHREIYSARGSSTRNFKAVGMDGVKTIKYGVDVGYGVLHVVSGIMQTTGAHNYTFEGVPLSRTIDERGVYLLAGLHFPYLQFYGGTVMPLDQGPKLYNKLGNSLYGITAEVAVNLFNFF
jgi:hypothetical protein